MTGRVGGGTNATTTITTTSSSRNVPEHPPDIVASYLTHGGYREVFTLTRHRTADEDGGGVGGGVGGVVERVILKTNRVGKKGWSTYLLDKYRRDALVGERAGGGGTSPNSGVCPVYQYCAYTSVSPYSDVGPLDGYVAGRRRRRRSSTDGTGIQRDAEGGGGGGEGGGEEADGTTREDEREEISKSTSPGGTSSTNTDAMGPTEAYVLAMQAARGLYQSHLYRNGRPTNVHADIKPDQFLLFRRRGTVAVRDADGRRLRSRREDGPSAADDDDDDDGESATSTTTTTIPGTITTRAVLANPNVPILQIQDFNRGRYLTRSTVDDATCPFRMCDITHKGSTYRSPEEYMDCADQSDGIDVYALGGVFYYLLSDGRRPWYYVEDYDSAVERILGGEKSALPGEIPEGVEEELGEGAVTGDEESDVDAPIERERSSHPARAALKEIMMKCWEFKPEDRPSSLQVVQMLEEKWNDVIAPTISIGGVK